MNEYLTVEAAGEFEFVERKSRFIGHCYPVCDEETVEQTLLSLRKTYWDARHNCYAFRLGTRGGTARSSDDGEPSGTAGAPILNVLMRTGITDSLIVVTRYFGGVLLGAGGLIRAYSKAASGALKAAGVIRMRECREITVEASYPLYQTVDRCFREFHLTAKAEFSESVRLCALIPETEYQALALQIIDKTEGKCTPRAGETRYLPFREENPAGLSEDASNENS